MKFTIKKGKHRARPLQFKLHHDRGRLAFRVVFDKMNYTLPDADAADVNKLFGLAFIPWWKIPLVILSPLFFGLWRNLAHKDSIRFGWNYNYQGDFETVGIYAYWYVNGKREFTQIDRVAFGRESDMVITVAASHYFLDVIKTENRQPLARFQIPFSHKHKWCYRMGPFFGGNLTAPEDIDIYMEEI